MKMYWRAVSMIAGGVLAVVGIAALSVSLISPSRSAQTSQRSEANGFPSGIPRENYYSSPDGSLGGPIQIFQPPGSVVFFYETHHEFRIIPLDGRPHPGQNIKLWQGDSRGHWEGNTLVVDVTNNNDSTR